LVNKPEITEKVKELMKEAEARAQARGHELDDWKWDGHYAWRAWCQHRNCYASACVFPDEPTQPFGGNALF